MATLRELQILDSYLDPPDDPIDWDEYDRWWGIMSDILYEQMKEDEVLNRDKI